MELREWVDDGGLKGDMQVGCQLMENLTLIFLAFVWQSKQLYNAIALFTRSPKVDLEYCITAGKIGCLICAGS